MILANNGPGQESKTKYDCAIFKPLSKGRRFETKSLWPEVIDPTHLSEIRNVIFSRYVTAINHLIEINLETYNMSIIRGVTRTQRLACADLFSRRKFTFYQADEFPIGVVSRIPTKPSSQHKGQGISLTTPSETDLRPPPLGSENSSPKACLCDFQAISSIFPN